jgi:hypothetical protein
MIEFRTRSAIVPLFYVCAHAMIGPSEPLGVDFE